MGRHLIITLIAMTFLAAAAAPIVAGPPTPEEKAAAKKVVAGKELQDNGHHEEAIILFEEAWALSSHPKILFYKARSEHALKRYEKARETYLLVQEKSGDLEPDKLAEVERNLEAIRRLLDKTLLRFVTPGVTGAMVTVDGTPVGPTPVNKPFRRGTYQVHAALEGYTAAEKLVVVKGEPEITVTLPMKRFLMPEEIRWKERQRNLSIAAWTTLGTGIAAFGTGVGFLGNYLDKTNRNLGPNQHVEDGVTDLAVGGTLTVVGAALSVTSAVLFAKAKKRYRAPTAYITPLPGGAVLGLSF